MRLKRKRDTSAFPESLTAATKWLSESRLSAMKIRAVGETGLHFATDLIVMDLKRSFITSIQLDLTENHCVMKLCLKWHNLSLLYIWSSDQIE